jgi:hypothetical protein
MDPFFLFTIFTYKNYLVLYLSNKETIWLTENS